MLNIISQYYFYDILKINLRNTLYIEAPRANPAVAGRNVLLFKKRKPN